MPILAAVLKPVEYIETTPREHWRANFDSTSRGQKFRLLPYFIPVLTTLVFIATVYLKQYWIGPLLIPFLTLFHKKIGKFTPKEVVAEYLFFEKSSQVRHFLLFNGLFFLLFQLWIGFYLFSTPLKVWQLLLFLYSVLILNANFTSSLLHELMHLRGELGKWLSNILLLLCGFFYLRADHLFIHHPHVGTSSDPASARLGVSFWKYFLASVSGRIRILFGKKLSYPITSNHRQATLLGLILEILFLTIAFLLNKQLFFWMLTQFILVPFIYEIITYIQHYGLTRITEPNVEKLKPQHSWNCFYKLSAYMHFMMPVHSLHHVHAAETKEENIGPSMPKPFQSMVLLALWPKLWRKAMDARAVNVLKGLPCQD